MRFDTLSDWLEWQSGLHPSPIDLGLERCSAVAHRMGLGETKALLATVAGTNGKGSCITYMEAVLRAGGHRVGTYLSPHLVRYNERIRIDGLEVSDTDLCRAFAEVDTARGDTSLTYFEFGTLAAMCIFAERDVGVVLLEVGLGGRLDAVNVFDANVAVLTSIGIDHVDWLGSDRESIGREKAGIMRAECPCVIGDRNPPVSVTEHGSRIGAPLYVLGRDYDAHAGDGVWQWRRPGQDDMTLTMPALRGPHQIDNAATALAAVDHLVGNLEPAWAERAMRDVALAGRFQLIARQPDIIVDVAHNANAAETLARALAQTKSIGRTLGVAALYKDKDVRGVATSLAEGIDEWYIAGLPGPRGGSGVDAAELVAGCLPGVPIRSFETVADAFESARRTLQADDRLVAFGSFETVRTVMQLAT